MLLVLSEGFWNQQINYAAIMGLSNNGGAERTSFELVLAFSGVTKSRPPGQGERQTVSIHSCRPKPVQSQRFQRATWTLPSMFPL